MKNDPNEYSVSKSLRRARELVVSEAPGVDRQDYTTNDVWNLALEVVRLTNALKRERAKSRKEGGR